MLSIGRAYLLCIVYRVLHFESGINTYMISVVGPATTIDPNNLIPLESNSRRFIDNGSRLISGSVSPNGLMVQYVCPSVSRNTPDPSTVVCRVKFLLSITKFL